MPDPKARLRRARLIHTLRDVSWRERAAEYADAQTAHVQWNTIAERVAHLAHDYARSKEADNGHMLRAQRSMAAGLGVVGADASQSAARALEDIAAKRRALGEASERRKVAGEAAKSAEKEVRRAAASHEILVSRKTGTAFE